MNNLMNTLPTTMTLISLLKEIEVNTYPIDSSYNQGYFWNTVLQNALLESIMFGYPIGSFVIHEAPSINKIIDGQQRIQTLSHFYQNTFSLNNTISYKLLSQFIDTYKDSDDKTHIKIHKKFNEQKIITRLTFKDFSPAMKTIFETYNLPIIKIYNTEEVTIKNYRSLVHKQDTLIAHNRLNTIPQHIFSKQLQENETVIHHFKSIIGFKDERDELTKILFNIIGIFDNNKLKLGSKDSEITNYIVDLHKHGVTPAIYFDQILSQMKLFSNIDLLVNKIKLRKLGVKLLLILMLMNYIDASNYLQILENVYVFQQKSRTFFAYDQSNLQQRLQMDNLEDIENLRNLAFMFRGTHNKQDIISAVELCKKLLV